MALGFGELLALREFYCDRLGRREAILMFILKLSRCLSSRLQLELATILNLRAKPLLGASALKLLHRIRTSISVF